MTDTPEGCHTPDPVGRAIIPIVVRTLEELLPGRVAVLTGAGISTDSGIPDYRGPTTRERVRQPMQHRTFVEDAEARRRYWARSLVGWPRIRDAQPNAGHEALAALESGGRISGVITQNVDGLHQRAGSRSVIELHGALADVTCLTCHALEPRERLQARLLRLNPDAARVAPVHAPDGDADVSDLAAFVVPGCVACDGVLKPDVVFFGGSVPRARVDASYALVDDSDALLVVGSSLAVFSGLRFVRRAHAAGKPIAIVNLGPTRGDPMATAKIEASASATLATWARSATSAA